MSASQSFTLGVHSVNDYPQFIVPVGDQVLHEDEVIQVPFVIGDVETPAELLVIGGKTYNPALVLGVGISGTGSNHVLTIASLGNTFGTALIELRVRDQAGVRTTNLFTVTVLPVEDPPSISPIDDAKIAEDSELNVNFFVDDPETAASNLLVSAESSNLALFRNDAFTFTGTGTSRMLNARPVTNANGASRITVFVRDEAGLVASNSFLVTVDPVNDPPFISEIPPIEISINQTSSPISFTVTDLESPPDSLTLTAISTNTVLAPVSGVQFDGSGSNRTVRITPGTGQFGWMVLRVRAADPDGGITTRDFELFVQQTNGPPVIFQQPAALSVVPGTPVILRVIATGPGLTYRWQRDGQSVPGQTNATLNITLAAPADRGEYRVMVINSEGTTTSAPAQLNVLEGTRILGLRRAGSSTVELTFGTIAKQRYFVEFQNILGTAWTALPSVVGTGGVMTIVDPAAGSNSRFYRVRIE